MFSQLIQIQFQIYFNFLLFQSMKELLSRSSHSILLSCMLKALSSTDLLALFDVSSIYEQLHKTFEHSNNRNSITISGGSDNNKTRRSRCKSTNEGRVENVVNEKNTLEYLGRHMTNKISFLPLLEILFDKLKNVKSKSNFVQTSFFDLFHNLPEAKHFTGVQPINLHDQTYNLFLEKSLENFKELDFILENVLDFLLSIAVQPIIQIRGFHQVEMDHDDVLVDSVCAFINVLLKELLVVHLKNNVGYPNVCVIDCFSHVNITILEGRCDERKLETGDKFLHKQKLWTELQNDIFCKGLVHS